jgi:FkbM family methyltransferase
MDKLFKWCQNPKRVIDIGANKGEFSLPIKSKFPDCSIELVEANPLLEPLLQKTGLNYTIATLSDKKEVKSLFVEKENILATGASYYKENTDWYAAGKYFEIPTETQTLDYLNLFESEKIDLIKIDCQGAELDIIKGGYKTCSRATWLLVEVSLVEYNLGAPKIEEVTDWITLTGFELRDILEYHRLPGIYSGNVFQMDLLFKNSVN